MTDSDLARFIRAQVAVLTQVEAELKDGRKRTHWMSFMFPQLEGLGHSTTAQQFAITGLDQARRYLADPVLGKRLRQHVRLMLEHTSQTVTAILGKPDDLKFRSCLTLFHEAASDPTDLALFADVLRQFFEGDPDPKTKKGIGD